MALAKTCQTAPKSHVLLPGPPLVTACRDSPKGFTLDPEQATRSVYVKIVPRFALASIERVRQMATKPAKKRSSKTTRKIAKKVAKRLTRVRTAGLSS